MGDLEGLGEEALDLAGAGDGHLVLLRQLVHTQDGDDVLEGGEEVRWRGGKGERRERGEEGT